MQTNILKEAAVLDNKNVGFGYLLTLFLFVADLNWNIFPISTRKFIGVVGLCYFFCRQLKSNNRILYQGFNLYVVIFIILIFSFIINGHFDISIFAMFVGRLMSVLGAYFIFSVWKNVCLNSFLKSFIFIVLVNDLFALMLFLLPSLADFFMTLEPTTEFIMETYGGLRFVGLGCFRFFEGGIINAIAIISTIYLYISKEYTYKKTLGLIILFLFLGVFIARTSLIGLLGFLFVFYPSIRAKVKLIRIGVTLIGISVGIFIILNIVFADNPALGWAFEIVYNYLEKGNFETTSTNDLLNSYVFPDSLKSWIIGDGKWIDDDGRYYMHTDVGFCRLLLLFGLSGTLFYFLYIGCIAYSACKKREVGIKFLMVIVCLLLIAVNLKGFSDFPYFIFPLLFYANNKEKSFS